ncbi:MAG: beta-N-acetylhexosaminidase [Clostridium sp.]|nr:beta-N-acetylhexosaminidase [Clostridium sp.]
MKNKLSLLLVLMTMSMGWLRAADFINLTPRPAQLVEGEGELTLHPGLKIGHSADLPEEMITEISRFVASFNLATGLQATAETGTGLFNVAFDGNVPAEGYTLVVTTEGVEIKASTAAGLYYAFQTVKKILPPNVMAGVAGEEGVTYVLPVVEITDAPRYEYRGYMLDVSRHFFDVDQIKKMLDVMAMYKLNRFHWHLTDDQGWRLPVAKYPKLTVEGATNRNILRTDFDQPQQQWREGLDVAYGPYAYTLDELKEVVAYAKERHIEVMPEIDMPGHMVAAIHAYPEFSTDPESKIALAAGIDMNSEPVAGNIPSHFTHNIWNIGGVSRDVLDVSNPKVIQFVKDVVDVLAEVFPYEYIHIGGDECPTYAWENSASCQELKTKLGLNSDRALQSWFTKEIADYARETYGRKIMGWNELVTSGGVDMEATKELDPVIMCWVGANNAANVSQNNGLKHIFTPHDGGYYINRCYRGFDRVGAVGDGSIGLSYNTNPTETSLCIGVQGTFWCEQVDRPRDVEYLTLPRLLAIAEHGWTPANLMNYDDFMERACADSVMLNLAGYNYARHQLVSSADYRKPDPEKWYRMTSICSDERSGRVWEVLAEGSPLISQYGDKKAQANRLWSNTVNESSEWQLFRFVEDPDNTGRYAIVCKALPEGSLSATPTGTGTGDRWDYQPSTVNYAFEFDRTYYNPSSDDIQYAIRPAGSTNTYLNFSKSGQGLAINVYNNPGDGNGGVVLFTEAEVEETPNPPTPPVSDVPEQGVYYRLLTRFNGADTQARYGSCIELLRDDAGKGNNAQADRLWSNAPAQAGDANYAYQWFTFEADPAGSGYYAMVCKAKPEGSVNSVPAVANNANTARWDYDATTKHYGFYLVDQIGAKTTQGIDDKGFYSALTSKDAASGWYMNTSAAGQGYAIHLYSDPTDQNAGLYTFEPDPTPTSIGRVTLATEGEDAVYDLQGRRVQTISAPGVYIIGGRKVIVK